MSNFAIRCDGLSKEYRIGSSREPYKALRDVITEAARAPFRRLRSGANSNGNKAATLAFDDNLFWALDDVSCEIKPGEVVGIIGRNGAGKSTLLRILSRITKPTRGSAQVCGRVGSLLEVGTGFHPELTGRENVLLNGAILGMRNSEIRRKFDEIVAFAEVEKFVDTPVKRYSSGMYMRLAFAVAAHLETEILLVDEVLAVGDAQFQKKSLGKMEEVGRAGRTVLFVSHNLSAIRDLCDRGLLFSSGKLKADCSAAEAINLYHEGFQTLNHEYVASASRAKPHLKRATVTQDGCDDDESFAINKAITLSFEIETFNNANVSVAILIRNERDLCIYHSSDEFSAWPLDRNAKTRQCVLPAYALATGSYSVDVHLHQRHVEIFEVISGALQFSVHFEGTLASMTGGSDWKGTCGPGLLQWS